MKLQIAKEILDQADRCTKNYHCLSVDGGSCSSLAPLLFGEQRFTCQDAEPCAYKVPFGSNFFCTCPVRKAVFRQTGK